jgi:hypothetical protein
LISVNLGECNKRGTTILEEDMGKMRGADRGSRDNLFRVEGDALLEFSQASPARPSDKERCEIEWLAVAKLI